MPSAVPKKSSVADVGQQIETGLITPSAYFVPWQDLPFLRSLLSPSLSPALYARPRTFLGEQHPTNPFWIVSLDTQQLHCTYLWQLKLTVWLCSLLRHHHKTGPVLEFRFLLLGSKNGFHPNTPDHIISLNFFCPDKYSSSDIWVQQHAKLHLKRRRSGNSLSLKSIHDYLLCLSV